MSTITGTNAVIMLSIPLLFPIPQQLQGFAADDVFDTDTIESAETVMGVDGKLSAGYVNVPINQTYALQADSESNIIFDTWWAVQRQVSDVYFANGVCLISAVGRKWTMTRGVLTQYKPIPDVKKLLQPRRYRVTWQSIFPVPA